MEKEKKADTMRISSKLIEYIFHVKKRHKEEYGINISTVESSKLIAERAIKNKIFN